MNYNNQFNASGISFDAPLASVYIEYVDPISTLEQERDKLLDTLEADKEVFIGWLTTINIKHVSTLKIEMLELLVSCWLASEQHCKANNVHKQELFKLAYKS
jgi:hypothetical protein